METRNPERPTINVQSSDRLTAMFAEQLNLMEHIREKHGRLKYPISQDVTSIVAELGEILEHVQEWKHWRSNPPEVDHDHKEMEVADLWHFIIQLTIRLGVTPETLYNTYMKKNKVNHQRQENDY